MLGSQFRLCSAGRVGGEGSGGLRAGWGRALPSRRWDACFWSFFVAENGFYLEININTYFGNGTIAQPWYKPAIFRYG